MSNIFSALSSSRFLCVHFAIAPQRLGVNLWPCLLSMGLASLLGWILPDYRTWLRNKNLRRVFARRFCLRGTVDTDFTLWRLMTVDRPGTSTSDIVLLNEI